MAFPLVRAHSLSLVDLTALRSQHAVGTRQARGVLAAFRRLHTGVLDVVVAGGECHTFQGDCAGPHAQIEVRDGYGAAEVLHLRAGSIQGYLANAWDSADLPALLTLIELNPQIFSDRPHWSWWRALRALIERHVSANVHARYRLTNDFYRAWLDPSLTYSAALFDAQLQRSLEQAQIAKFEHILQALRPEPGALLLDIGCGWGAFARHAAIHYGCRVHTITISRRQVEWARSRIHAAGLARSVTVQLCDFRQVSGRYDHVVSVEAYEALGSPAWGDYFHTIARCLNEGGKAFVQAAVVSDAAFQRDGGRSEFLRRNIQGNAQLATWDILDMHARQAGLTATSVVRSDDDYVRTLHCWRARFSDARPQLAKLGLDRRFQRLWHFYLAHCEAGYRAGVTRLVQAQLEHGEPRARSPHANRSAGDENGRG